MRQEILLFRLMSVDNDRHLVLPISPGLGVLHQLTHEVSNVCLGRIVWLIEGMLSRIQKRVLGDLSINETIRANHGPFDRVVSGTDLLTDISRGADTVCIRWEDRIHERDHGPFKGASDMLVGSIGIAHTHGTEKDEPDWIGGLSLVDRVADHLGGLDYEVVGIEPDA